MPGRKQISKFPVLLVSIAAFGLTGTTAHAGPSYVVSARIAYVRARMQNRQALEDKINMQRRLRREFKTSDEVNTTMDQFRHSTRQRTFARGRVETSLIQHSHDYRQAVTAYSRARTHSFQVSLNRSGHPQDILDAAQTMIDRDRDRNRITRSRLNVDEAYIEAHQKVLFYVRKLMALKREFEASLQSHPMQAQANRRLELARRHLDAARAQLRSVRRGHFRVGNREAPLFRLPAPPR